MLHLPLPFDARAGAVVGTITGWPIARMSSGSMPVTAPYGRDMSPTNVASCWVM